MARRMDPTFEAVTGVNLLKGGAPMRSRSVLGVTAMLVLAMLTTTEASAASTGPALRVRSEDAAAALSCPEQFSGAHEPLLFIHGTSYTAKQAWSWNYGKVL